VLLRAPLFLLLSVAIACHADTLTGTVVSVTDGDTITVLDAYHEQHKVRVAGIDAPDDATSTTAAPDRTGYDFIMHFGRSRVVLDRFLPAFGPSSFIKAHFGR